jgi:hypothetical protein
MTRLNFATTALLAAVAAAGCGTGTQQLATAHYTLTAPDYWKVKKQAARDGDPTIVVIQQYGSAVIDEGAGAMAAKDQNYDAVTADVEVRLYTWPDPGGDDPTKLVSQALVRDQDLQLNRHLVIPENPPECNVYPKKYTIFGSQQTPLDLVSRPGWRTIVVGARANGFLLGVVSRVEYEQDMARECHNLSNMRVQLQNLFDGLVANNTGGKPAPPSNVLPPPSSPPPPGTSPPGTPAEPAPAPPTSQAPASPQAPSTPVATP